VLFTIPPFLKQLTVLTFLNSIGILFQSSAILFVKKFLRSSLAAWGRRFSGSAVPVLLVCGIPDGNQNRACLTTGRRAKLELRRTLNIHYLFF
jgi:hypothetical protein